MTAPGSYEWADEYLRRAFASPDVAQLLERMLDAVEQDETTHPATVLLATLRLAALVLAEHPQPAPLVPLCGFLVERLHAEATSERGIGASAEIH